MKPKHDNLDLDDTLRRSWDARGICETDLAVDAGGTIVSGAPTVAAPMAFSAVVAALPRVDADGDHLVALGAEIGRGGMGVVRSARQRALDREVAVKTTLETTTEHATQALLLEAWISGQLEHPNIIPVHALYREGDAPLLVMKRVEGRAWSTALREGGSLVTHLRTLVQVCHAVHFAHDRGFVHLDLKPENVMIGSYGEIYLLDWGIAASLRDDMPDFIPRARDIRGLLGTPHYMAPELASGGDGTIDERTDVYLLGAVLHQILTGKPPHAAKTLMASVLSAYKSRPPSWPADVPQELATIAGKALARDPAERYGSAAELREALEDYLVHADSLKLTAAAQERFDRILEALDGDGSVVDAKTGNRRATDQGEVDRLAGEAEFGFRQALHVWPQNDEARTALQALLERLIERDLDTKNWQLAARRLADLPTPRPELEARVDALRQASSEVVEELERLREDADLGKADQQRAFFGYFGAFAWTAALGGLGIADRFGLLKADHLHMLLITLGAAVAFSTITYRARRALFSNTINRNAVALLAMGWFSGVLYWVAMWAVGAPFQASVVGIGPLIAFVIAAAAASVDRRLVPHAVVGVLGMIVLLLLPSWGLFVMALTGAVVLTMLGRTWGSKPSQGDRRDS